jgi:hypothetical protein
MKLKFPATNGRSELGRLEADVREGWEEWRAPATEREREEGERRLITAGRSVEDRGEGGGRDFVDSAEWDL